MNMTPYHANEVSMRGLLALSFIAGVSLVLIVLCTPVAPYALGWIDSMRGDESVDLLHQRLSVLGVDRANSRRTKNARLRGYEDELRKRSAALDAVLRDAIELDYNSSGPKKDPKGAARDSNAKLGGIGGKETLAPIMRLLPKGAPSRLKQRLMENQTSEDLVDLIEFQVEELARLPIGAPVQGRLSSGYGKRRSPFSRRRSMHHGIDFAVDYRTGIAATADGVIKKAGYIGAYGRTVVIDHGNGFETLYGHMTKIKVKIGDKICRGQQIGLAGSTGRSTGPHVHYEIRQAGEPTDPSPFVELASILKLI